MYKSNLSFRNTAKKKIDANTCHMNGQITRIWRSILDIGETQLIKIIGLSINEDN